MPLYETPPISSCWHRALHKKLSRPHFVATGSSQPLTPICSKRPTTVSVPVKEVYVRQGKGEPITWQVSGQARNPSMYWGVHTPYVTTRHLAIGARGEITPSNQARNTRNIAAAGAVDREFGDILGFF